jgi:hypothetical protein
MNGARRQQRNYPGHQSRRGVVLKGRDCMPRREGKIHQDIALLNPRWSMDRLQKAEVRHCSKVFTLAMTWILKTMISATKTRPYDTTEMQAIMLTRAQQQNTGQNPVTGLRILLPRPKQTSTIRASQTRLHLNPDGPTTLTSVQILTGSTLARHKPLMRLRRSRPRPPKIRRAPPREPSGGHKRKPTPTLIIAPRSSNPRSNRPTKTPRNRERAPLSLSHLNSVSPFKCTCLLSLCLPSTHGLFLSSSIPAITESPALTAGY